MNIIIRQPALSSNNVPIIREINKEACLVSNEAIMAIDASTTNSGIAILRRNDGALYYSISVARDKKNENPVEYKIKIKEFVKDLLLQNRNITKVFYEEPFIGYSTSVSNLMMLRTFVDEILIENKETLGYVEKIEVNNKKWKAIFIAPEKCPNNTELEKKAVRDKLEKYMPYMSIVTQDEIDAIGLGFSAVLSERSGNNNIESVRKTAPFKYDVEFIGSDDDDTMLEDFMSLYSGPKKILENGILLTYCGASENFDNHVYKNMGSDDKVLIVRFDSTKHGNLILKYRIGNLSATYSYIYAVVWRKLRR